MPFFHIAHCVLFGAALMVPAPGVEVTPADGPHVITRVAEIRALSREDAARALPVRIRGVVTWWSLSENGDFVVDDGEQDVYERHFRQARCR